MSEIHAWSVVRHGPPREALALERLSAPAPTAAQIPVRVAASVCNYNEVDGCHGRYRTIDPPTKRLIWLFGSVVVCITGP